MIIDYNWRGLIALSQKLTPSIGKIENEEIYYAADAARM